MNGICAFVLAAAFYIYASSVDVRDTLKTDNTWTADTIKVTGSLLVADGVTLTIEPGTCVEFQDAYKLEVKGRLLAAGAPADTIVFTAADTSAGWLGIRFNSTLSSNDSSVFDYCRIENSRSSEQNTLDPHRGALSLVFFSKVRVSHCTFTGNAPAVFAGAIACIGSSPVISDNLFTGNSAAGGGGAIGCNSSSPRIINNRITGNTAYYYGGGIYLEQNSSPLIENNIITGNSVPNGAGGGIGIGSGSAILINNLIAGNTCRTYGGGIICDRASPSITNCTIVNNRTQFWGGGLNCLSASPILTNTILWGNSAGQYGPQVYLWDSLSAVDFMYCAVQGGVSAFKLNGAYKGSYQNNVENAPLFVDSANDNFSLQGTSPCINTGALDTTGLALPGLDLAGNTRLAWGRIDMGAYEYQDDIRVELGALRVTDETVQSYPNPFRSAITFLLNGSEKASITVYDIRGKGVKSAMKPVCGKVTWEGVDDKGYAVPSGLYLCKIMIENEIKSIQKVKFIK